MNILVDGWFFQIANSGIATVWTELLRSWAVISPDHKFVFLRRGGCDIQVDGLEKLDAPLYPIDACYDTGDLEPVIRDQKWLSHICREKHIDLFCSTYYSYVPEVTNVLMIHDCIPERYPELFNADEPVWKIKRHAIDNAHSFICVSRNTAKDLCLHYGAAADKKLIVAYNGVSQHDASGAGFPLAEELKRKLRIDKPYVLLPGLDNRASYKNHAFAMEGLASFAKRGELQVVCTGHRAERLLAEYQDLVPAAALLGGNFSPAELHLLYLAAEFVIYPSRYEGFGLPALEAMAVGVPVIVCDAPAVTEIVGNAAVFVAHGDLDGLRRTIAALLATDGGVRKSFCEYAQRYSERFSWQHMARRIDAHARQIHLEKAHHSWMTAHASI